MKVVLDTNIIFSDFHFKGAKIKNLCESIKSTGNTVYIPEVVIDESINKYREELQSGKVKIERGLSDVYRLTGKDIYDPSIVDTFISNEIKNYAKNIREQIKKLGIKTIPYPTITHEELVMRDLARKRPFQESGKGYRDALIWMSVLSICERTSDIFYEPKLAFITKNHNDFCKSDFSLHPDLKEDLVRNGATENYIKIIEDIDTFINDYIKPKQKILKNILDKLNVRKQYNDIDLNDEVENRLSKFLLHRDFDEDSPFRKEFENPSVVGIDEPSIKINDVRQISDDEILIEVGIEVDCEFDFYIFKSDAYCMDEDELPHIWNNDWNKHYMAASETAMITLKMFLIVDSGFNEVLSDEICIL